MKYLLTIAIPSSGRIATLNKNIDYLKTLVIKNHLEQSIEIIISDTANTINKNIINYKHSFLKYYHSQNKDLDENIFTLIKKSSGKYIWFCQDHTKLIESSILKIIKILQNNKNLKYIFASTKKNYKLDNITKKNGKLIGFRCVYLNTNIVEKDSIEKQYQKIFDRFNGSHVVFQHSIIYILLNLNNHLDYIILKDQNSFYKFFDDDVEHKKYTWSNDLNNYLKILSFSKLMIDDIQNTFSIDNHMVQKLYRKNDYSVQTIFKIAKLIIGKNNYNYYFDKFILSNVLGHPTFSKFDKFFLKLILLKNKYIIFLIKYFYLGEFYLLIFLPNIFIKKFFAKLTNFFK